MAIITTREVGATAKGTPLSNAEIDNNFINLNADIATRVPASEKGAVNGVATLDDAGKVPATQLPSYVDDVLEYANLAAFPATGETGKIYVALDTNKTYRWSGSAYIFITSGAVDSVAGKTGVVTLNSADVGLANVDNTSDANKPVSTATQTALNTKQAALGYTPVNKAGDTITGDLLNSAAYSAPNNASGAGTKVLISGSTGTGAAGATGGNGYIEIIGSGATSSLAWTAFTGSSARRRGGVHIKSGTAQADVADTYRHGSYIDIIASNGTNSQTLIGDGGRVLVRSGGGGGYGGIPNNGASVTLLGATSTSSGRAVLASGSYTGASFTSNPGSSIDISAATAEASSSIRLYIGQAGGGSNVPGSVSGKAYVNRGTDYEILDAGNYSSYAQPLLVSGTTIKTINGTSVLGSGDIVISADSSDKLPLTGGTLTGAIIIGESVAASADSTATALSYGRLQGYGHIHINADTDQSTTEFVYITAGYATANSSSANGLAVGNTTLTWKDNAVLHAGNYNSYALPLTGGTLTGGLLIGSNGTTTAYGASSAGKLYFGSSGSDAPEYYHIGTTMEDVGGNYSKLDIKWYTGIRSYAHYAYGGFRFKEITTGATLFSVGETDLNVRVANTLLIGSNTALHAGNYSSYALPLSGGTVTGVITSSISSGTVLNMAGQSDSFGYNGTSGLGTYIKGTGSTYIYGGGKFWDGSTVHDLVHAGNSQNYKARSLNAVRTTNSDFNALATAVDTFTAGTNYIPSGGAYNQPADGDHHYLSWGGIEGSAIWAAQIDINFYDDRVWFRRQAGANWQAWRQFIHDGNYNSYAPTLTGGGASGTWGISVTGSSGSVSTSGGYTLTGNGSEGSSSSWIQFPNGQGIWSPTNSAHLVPNGTGSYGSWHMYGSRNGWHGLHFGSGSTLMMNSSVVGFHREGSGWQMRWDQGVGYISKGNPGGGTDAVILDASNYSSYALPLFGGTINGNVTINGVLSATSKSFLITHPTKPGKKLRYGSLEGPENGVYIRGKLRGNNKIELPEYWTKLVDADSISVTLTPVGKHQKLYVEDIADNVVTVANDGFFAGEINCFFVVYGERVDVAKLVVESE
jgi:hypothetical protein